MKSKRAFFSLPLLAKELIELAARRRTYITRVVYAVLLYGFFAWSNDLVFRGLPVNAIGVLGSGWAMFIRLIGLQFAGIYLFLPAMAAGQITQEKERDSLVLLLLTELSPWQILLQKYAAALISMFSFLLIGMPLAALAYSFGGVSPVTLLTNVYVLFLTCLQVAAFALLCSAHFRTTVGAFLATYFGGIGIFFALWMLGGLLHRRHSGVSAEACLSVFPIRLLKGNEQEIGTVLMASVPSVAMTGVFVVLARFYLISRAFAPATNRLLALFRRIDAFMRGANRLVGNVTFRAKDRALPQDEPIAWREMTRRSLGRPEYLVRVLLVVEVIAIVACLFAGYPHAWSNENQSLSMIAAVIGTLAVLTLSAFAANSFVSERLNQTLEVLLTTPLTAKEIVRQKARTLTRFMWVLAAPLMTVFGFEAWSEDIWTVWLPSARVPHSTPLYLVGAALTVAIYLPLVMWLSIWIGLKVRTRFRTILTALGVIIGWCVLPIVQAAMLDLDPYAARRALVFLLSPLMFPAFNETTELHTLHLGSPWNVLALNFTFYGALTLLFRDRCLRHADRYLRG